MGYETRLYIGEDFHHHYGSSGAVYLAPIMVIEMCRINALDCGAPLPIAPYWYADDGDTKICVDGYDYPLYAYDAKLVLADLEAQAETDNYWRLSMAARALEGLILAHLTSGRTGQLVAVPFGH